MEQGSTRTAGAPNQCCQSKVYLNFQCMDVLAIFCVPARFKYFLSVHSILLAQELRFEDELFPLHRLDSGTEGVCVLGKTRLFAKRFGQIMQSSSALSGHRNFMHKTYLALAPKPAPLGILRHWAAINTRAPGLPPFTLILPSQPTGPCDGKVSECMLEVVQVRKRFKRVSCLQPSSRSWSGCAGDLGESQRRRTGLLGSGSCVSAQDQADHRKDPPD